MQSWERRLNSKTCSSNTILDQDVCSFSRGFTDTPVIMDRSWRPGVEELLKTNSTTFVVLKVSIITVVDHTQKASISEHYLNTSVL